VVIIRHSLHGLGGWVDVMVLPTTDTAEVRSQEPASAHWGSGSARRPTSRLNEWKRSALSGRLKLFARAGDLGRGPFDGVAEYVGPASAAAVVGVVVVPTVDAVVVGRFGPTGSGLAHRREGTGPDLVDLDSQSRTV